tara:strand:- start:6793 stop:7344 length:552 start_codon:yes stop_codon:yes gene_type:complete
MHDLPDLSQMCVDHAPAPTAGKTYKSKNPHMQRSHVHPNIVHRKNWHPLPKSATELIDLKGRVFKAFDEESKGPNLYSMTKMLPILMEMGMAMAEYSKILPKLVQALLKTETGLGLVQSQRDTRQLQALNILQTLYKHSDCRPPKDCKDPLEGARFRIQLQQAMQQAMSDKATYDKWYGLIFA